MSKKPGELDSPQDDTTVDGTKVDEHGNPIVDDPKPEIDAEEKKGLVQEVIAKREENNELKAKLAEYEAKGNPTPDTTEKVEDGKVDISAAIQAELDKRDAQRATDNRTKALEKFIANHKEFHEDNDPAGIKLEALKAKLKRFNTAGITESEDFEGVITDAYRLMVGHDTQSEQNKEYPNSSTPGVSGAEPKETITDKELSQDEIKLIETNDSITRERLLELKEKNPGMLESLIQTSKTFVVS